MDSAEQQFDYAIDALPRFVYKNRKILATSVRRNDSDVRVVIEALENMETKKKLLKELDHIEKNIHCAMHVLTKYRLEDS